VLVEFGSDMSRSHCCHSEVLALGALELGALALGYLELGYLVVSELGELGDLEVLRLVYLELS
jgi:hypothetical protein